MKKAYASVVAVLLLGTAIGAGNAGAAEIKVLSTGNMASILADVTGEFERTTGNKLVIEYGSTTRMKARIENDEAADLTINERFVLEDLLETGPVSPPARSWTSHGRHLRSRFAPAPQSPM